MTPFSSKEFGISHKIAICFFLVMAVSIVYWQIGDYPFIEFDDEEYIAQNPHIQAGLTRESIAWAFTTTRAVNWHPVTWMSHLMDMELYGLHPGMHHRTSLLFHILNTLLLFHVFHRLSGEIWPSCFIALVFALHPLQVESVVWISERKNVLSTFFWMMTLWMYSRYVEHPGVYRYLWGLFFFALGLMAKPMLVTLPFILILLDYWPLGRMCHLTAPGRINPLIFKEKIPFFILSATASVVTFLVQMEGGAVKSLDAFPLGARLGNMLVAYLAYLYKIIWPHNLAIYYPHPGGYSVGIILFAGLILGLLSFFLLRYPRQYPYLTMGWLWFLGTLVPVIGLVQVGLQSMADRYAYIPMIGVLVIIAWSLKDLLSRWTRGIRWFGLLGGVLGVALSAVTWFQIHYWSDSLLLFQRALDVTPDSYEIHYKMGGLSQDRGRIDKAVFHFRQAVRLSPDTRTYNALGKALLENGKPEEARVHLISSLKHDPLNDHAHNNLGNLFARRGSLAKAKRNYANALNIRPSAEVNNNLGLVLIRRGNIDEAIFRFRKAIKLEPGHPTAGRNLKRARDVKGRIDSAVSAMKEALSFEPDRADVTAALSRLHDAKKILDRAIAHYQAVLSPQPGYYPSALDLSLYPTVGSVLEKYERSLAVLNSEGLDR